MTVEEIKIWVDVGQTVLTLGLTYLLWTVKQHQASRESIAALAELQRAALHAAEQRLDERVDGLDTRLVQVETSLRLGPSPTSCAAHIQGVAVVQETLRHLPGHEDMKRVHQRIDGVSDIVSEVRGRLQGIERGLTILHEYFMENGGAR